MSNTPSVTVHYAQAIVQAAERLALPLPPALRELGGGARISLERQEMLWEAFCSAAQDPLIGLRLGNALQVGHLDMVGALLMSCETVGEALGFADESSFAKAFRRWSGMTPGQFRQGLGQ